MFEIRKSDDRGLGDHGWLNTKHTFSFADYYDSKFMGFRSLRVINEDIIAGGTGFGAHPHRDMEIITYVVEGALLHNDSMGSKTRIVPGEVQRMSAGSGVVHSEFNALADAPTHLFQIWIMPKTKGGVPSYAQKSFEQEWREKKSVLVVSETGREGSLSINQDADLYISRLKKSDKWDFALRPERGAWIQVVKGHLQINEVTIAAGDGASFVNSDIINILALSDCEFLLFDLA